MGWPTCGEGRAGVQSCAGAQERIRVRAGELCVPIAGTEYVRRHAGGGENRAQPQERGGFRHTGQNHPTPDPGTGARLVALGGGCTIGWRAKRGFNPTRCAGRAREKFRASDGDREEEGNREGKGARASEREGGRERGTDRQTDRKREIAGVTKQRTRQSGVNERGVGGKAGERQGWRRRWRRRRRGRRRWTELRQQRRISILIQTRVHSEIGRAHV